jgi:hypothetical protein
MGFSFAVANSFRQALALLTGSPGKGSLTPCDTFTIPLKEAQAAGRIYP